MDINEQILNSINILIKAAMQNMSFDKTVKAIITYCGDNNKYKVGDYVYVLIPASDDNGTGKIILGKI